MQINLITIGKSSPSWINTAYEDYVKRLPKNLTINDCHLAPIRHTAKQSVSRIKLLESEKILAKITSPGLIIALDEHGKLWTSKELAHHLQTWQNEWQTINLLVGGPDGLADVCLQKAHYQWSLSPLTFPHHLVKVILVEQIYRAWSMLVGHPYHRG